MPLLHQLLRNINSQWKLDSIPSVEVTGVREDSRLIQPGDLFIARPGTQTNGGKFIADAAAKGAVAVVTETTLPDCPLPQLIVPDAGAAASILAHRLLNDPTTNLKMLGITGTNGKTTIAYLLRHVLNKLNRRCGMIGTVEIDDGKTRRESTMTTPGPVEVAELMNQMRDNGAVSCAMEVSSHSLHQGRVAGVRFSGAAFTNLTGDHLDYHKTMDEYAAAKARLFEMLPVHAVAVINDRDPWSDRMIRDCPARIIRYGFGKSADYRAKDVAITARGSKFILHTPDGRVQMNLQLIGKHNIENALAAVALLCEVFGLSPHQVAAGLKDAAGAPGRLQSVHAGQRFAVLVDYAHTDDALQNVLVALRPLTAGRLRVLFGCGGDRDRTKRPRMAAIAERLADDIYVTSDNPRTENARSILDEICSGFSDALSLHVEIDRRRAIQRVLADAQADDVVLVAGKGHENYQIIGTTRHHFDDVEECMRALGGASVAA